MKFHGYKNTRKMKQINSLSKSKFLNIKILPKAHFRDLLRGLKREQEQEQALSFFEHWFV